METIDIEEVADSGDYLPLEEVYEEFDEEELKLVSEVVDYSQTLQNLGKPIETIPYLTKYEKARILGVREKQLASGSIPVVSTKGLKSVKEIAKAELDARKIPILIKRCLPSGKCEYVSIDQLDII